MIILKRSEAENLYPKRFEVQTKRTPNSDWVTKHYEDDAPSVIVAAKYAAKFMVYDMRIIDNES